MMCFFSPGKHNRTFWICKVCRGYRKGALGKNWFISSLCSNWFLFSKKGGGYGAFYVNFAVFIEIENLVHFTSETTC